MENVSIQTSQNITISQPIASIGERIAAAALDMLFIGGYFFLVSIITAFSQNTMLMAIMMAPVAFYHILSELLMNGQSWGKKILKIRVTTVTGGKTGFFPILIRWVFRLIDVTLLFGSIATLAIIISKKGQRLGDIAAHTVVIRVREKSADGTLYTKLPENYTMNYPEVNKLNESDIYIVKEVLKVIEENHRSLNALTIADKTKRELEKKMGIQAGIRGEHFLFKVLRDYNHLHAN
jgi:uncharacterized RDD family membrane protein YckC